MNLNASIPVSDFLQATSVAQMQTFGEIAPVAELINPVYNVHQDLTVLADSNGAQIYDLTSIGNNQFANSTKTSLSLGNKVTSIGSYAFFYCSSFAGSLIIPNSVTSIGDYAFAGCTNLTGSLTIPNSATSIGLSAFSSCYGLTGDLIIPDSITSVANYILFNSMNITDVYTNVNASAFSSSAFYGSAVNQIYYKSGTTWPNPWNGIPTAVWTSWPDPMP